MVHNISDLVKSEIVKEALHAVLQPCHLHVSWWGFLGELKRHKWILHFSCAVDFSCPSLDPFAVMLLISTPLHSVIFMDNGALWALVCVWWAEASIGFYLVHTNSDCRIKNNIAQVSILLFNDTKISAPDDKILLVNLYHEPVKQLFNCWFFFFLPSCIKLIVISWCVSIN